MFKAISSSLSQASPFMIFSTNLPLPNLIDGAVLTRAGPSSLERGARRWLAVGRAVHLGTPLELR
jgi:hypothetical protein